jgi:ABC-type glutathione transport system ATPase component
MEDGARTLQDRYPGALPFGDTDLDRRRFFGREREIDDLSYQIIGTHLLVLFGKSGLGKTSLLQAGVFPRLREHDLLPIAVRLDEP